LAIKGVTTVISATVLAVCTAFSAAAQVEITSGSKILDEADKLVEIVPEQSKQIAQKFLTSRTLTNKDKSSNSRDDANNTLRTPATSIDALQVIAKAMLQLGDTRGALDSIDQAETLARGYQLDFVLLDTQILKAKLIWQIKQDESQVLPLISSIETQLQQNSDLQLLSNNINYQLLMLKADIASKNQQLDNADKLYKQAENFLNPEENRTEYVNYQIEQGEYHLKYLQYNRALQQLLAAYWTTVENDMPIELARINRILATLFYQKRVLDKSLEYLSQAADFYDNYEKSPILPNVLKQMADIYYDQGKYNLALVHYFNVLDAETINRNIEDVIELRLDLAKTYLQLYNFPLTEQYIKRANTLLSYTELDNLNAQSLLLQAQLFFQKGQNGEALKFAQSALKIGNENNNIQIQLNAHLLLTNINEANDNFQSAFIHGKQYNALITLIKDQLIEISEDDFRQQKLFMERSLHYKDQTDELVLRTQNITRYRYSTTVLFFLSLLLVILFIHRGMTNRKMRGQLKKLYQDHYTHPRSGLRNLRLLIKRLPSSLEQSSAHFEQWQTGELINEPLHDKLRFAMIDLPFLRTVYLRKGYNAGLELEGEFGEFIKTKVELPARLYHFSDAMFLYVEPNTSPEKTAEQLFNQITDWISEFEADKNIAKVVRLGIADYPFLPRAYTAINDKELIDILLMASNMARSLHIELGGNQWVCLRAIEHAPAASFANENIREACQQAIEKGLIKIDSSNKIEENIIKSSIID